MSQRVLESVWQRRLVIKRLWVQILAPKREWIIFLIYFLQNWYSLEIQKINEKAAVDGSYFLFLSFSHHNSNINRKNVDAVFGDQTGGQRAQMGPLSSGGFLHVWLYLSQMQLKVMIEQYLGKELNYCKSYNLTKWFFLILLLPLLFESFKR